MRIRACDRCSRTRRATAARISPLPTTSTSHVALSFDIPASLSARGSGAQVLLDPPPADLRALERLHARPVHLDDDPAAEVVAERIQDVREVDVAQTRLEEESLVRDLVIGRGLAPAGSGDLEVQVLEVDVDEAIPVLLEEWGAGYAGPLEVANVERRAENSGADLLHRVLDLVLGLDERPDVVVQPRANPFRPKNLGGVRQVLDLPIEHVLIEEGARGRGLGDPWSIEVQLCREEHG